MGYTLLAAKPAIMQAAERNVRQITGLSPLELDPETFYDTKAFQSLFQAVQDNLPEITAWAFIKVMGQQVYPLIDKTVGIPPEVKKDPLNFLKYEADGFLLCHRGIGVKPRVIMTAEKGHLVIEALSPGYHCALIDGVYDGILSMCGIRNPEIKQTKCVKRGDSTCIYDVTWPV